MTPARCGDLVARRDFEFECDTRDSCDSDVENFSLMPFICDFLKTLSQASQVSHIGWAALHKGFLRHEARADLLSLAASSIRVCRQPFGFAGQPAKEATSDREVR